MRRLLAITILVALTGYGTPAYALDTIGESIEWLVISRPAIALEEVTSAMPMRDEKTGDPEMMVRTRLKQAVKGNPPQEVSFIRRWQEGVAPSQGDASMPANGTPYLLFFNGFNQVTNAINLKTPSQRLGVGTAASDVAVSADFNVFKSGEVIMDTVRRALSRLPMPSDGRSPPSPRKVEIPIDAPAWSVFYDGGNCALLVPENVPDEGQEKKISRQAAFSGDALWEECHTLPRQSFEIKPASTGETATLTMKCVTSRESPSGEEKLVLIFNVQDIEREADYDFLWVTSPDPKKKGGAFFGGDEGNDCEVMARMLRVRALNGQTVPFTTSDGIIPPNEEPMAATATVRCTTDQKGTFGLQFQLSTRYATKTETGNVSNP